MATYKIRPSSTSPAPFKLSVPKHLAVDSCRLIGGGEGYRFYPCLAFSSVKSVINLLLSCPLVPLLLLNPDRGRNKDSQCL
jgi:hypothetical protein